MSSHDVANVKEFGIGILGNRKADWPIVKVKLLHTDAGGPSQKKRTALVANLEEDLRRQERQYRFNYELKRHRRKNQSKRLNPKRTRRRTDSSYLEDARTRRRELHNEYRELNNQKVRTTTVNPATYRRDSRRRQRTKSKRRATSNLKTTTSKLASLYIGGSGFFG